MIWKRLSTLIETLVLVVMELSRLRMYSEYPTAIGLQSEYENLNGPFHKPISFYMSLYCYEQATPLLVPESYDTSCMGSNLPRMRSS